MKPGFVPAVGTPLDQNGNLCVESYEKQIEDQINAGAIAILYMGSMGQQAFIRPRVCTDVARTAVKAVAGRVPVYVGVMDCSLSRASDRLASMEDLDVSGFVSTTPYYHSCSHAHIIKYFKCLAASTKKPILLYDLPSVTQSKITYDIVLELLHDVPNLAGIKSNDTIMLRKLKLNPNVSKDFLMFYSGLDMFDIAYKWGLDKCLDGMLACTPVNTGKMFAAMAEGNYDSAAVCLNNILDLRDFFASNELWACFSTAMNLLGYEGNHAPDYIPNVNEIVIPKIREELIRIGEL